MEDSFPQTKGRKMDPTNPGGTIYGLATSALYGLARALWWYENRAITVRSWAWRKAVRRDARVSTARGKPIFAVKVGKVNK